MNAEDSNSIEFYLTDIFEDYSMAPGQLFLFGRIPVQHSTESVCIVLKNVPRNLYFLPASKENGERFSVSEVKQEVFGIMNKLVQNPRELGFRIDRKKYAFEIADIPTEEVCSHSLYQIDGLYSHGVSRQVCRVSPGTRSDLPACIWTLHLV